jgi:hypothetical protein
MCSHRATSLQLTGSRSPQLDPIELQDWLRFIVDEDREGQRHSGRE